MTDDQVTTTPARPTWQDYAAEINALRERLRVLTEALRDVCGAWDDEDGLHDPYHQGSGDGSGDWYKAMVASVTRARGLLDDRGREVQ